MKFLLRLVTDNLHRFFTGALLGGGLFALLVGGLCYYLVSDQAYWRLVAVSILVSIGVMLAGLASGVRLAVTETLRDWVNATSVGPMLSKVIFKQALGVSDKRPEGSKAVAAELDGATVGQAKERLAEHLGDLFGGDSLDRWLPAQGRWIAKKLTGAAGWAITERLIEHIPGTPGDHARLDLLAMRDGLSDGLADKAVTLVTARATAVAIAAVGVAAVVNVLVAAALSV
ncbi:hypothetical protein Pla123a_48510 [Posidoniimonas polymericola]|uniref:Uncharacterized protein n=1 Tax=Posidoniimonas polymericola TaxID=2528002 RepID=A0A5C5XSR8_9BACT|nr:hypothetical protein [Posidoniimonas polymericola]TWT65940.1 hypothetical protein Pla123a_48510 [Posidoniimonas polymericola]